MAVGHLLLQSFWANEAIFQIMMLTYHGSTCYFDLSQTGKIISNVRICEMDRKKNDAKWRKLC